MCAISNILSEFATLLCDKQQFIREFVMWQAMDYPPFFFFFLQIHQIIVYDQISLLVWQAMSVYLW